MLISLSAHEVALSTRISEIL